MDATCFTSLMSIRMNQQSSARNTPEASSDPTERSSSPSTESNFSFTGVSDISDKCYGGVDPFSKSAATDQTLQQLSTMEATPLLHHSEYYMQHGMVDFQVR